MKHKTQKKSVLQAAQKAAQQKTIDKKQLKKECEHKNWNFDLGSKCPDCGANAGEVLKSGKVTL